MKPFGVVLRSAALGAALAASGPALAFGGGHMGGGFGGGGFHGGGFGGGGFHGSGFAGGHFGGFAGRSMAMGGVNHDFNRGMFTGRSVAMNRSLGINRGFDHRFARFDHFHHFRNRFVFFNTFDNFGLFGVPLAYDYAAYENGCWRQVWSSYGWQLINICYDYGGYNYGY